MQFGSVEPQNELEKLVTEKDGQANGEP